MAKSKPKPSIFGRWLIESMDQWDRDFIDAEVRGFFEFDAKGSGSSQFGYVQGEIDYPLTYWHLLAAAGAVPVVSDGIRFPSEMRLISSDNGRANEWKSVGLSGIGRL